MTKAEKKNIERAIETGLLVNMLRDMAIHENRRLTIIIETDKVTLKSGRITVFSGKDFADLRNNIRKSEQ